MNPELIEAIEKGNIEAVEKLIKSGVDIKQKDENGSTALHYAAVNGQIQMLEHLLSHNYSNSSERDTNGCTALFCAAANGQIQMLEHLLSHKYSNISERSNSNLNVLLVAAANGQIEMFEYLLAKKYSSLTERGSEGNSPLMIAVINNQIEMVDYLLSKKYYKISDKNDEGITLLLGAANSGHIEMLQYLLKMPTVSLQETCDKGHNALAWAAVKKNNKNTVAFLLKNGAYIDQKTEHGITARQHVQNYVFGFEAAAIPFIKDEPSDVKVHKVEFINPGHVSVTERSVPPLMLIECGFQLLQASEMLIQWAESKPLSKYDVSILDVLGENLNARRIADGNTALHLAIMNKNTLLIRKLLNRGADLLMPNHKNETPLQLLENVHIDDSYIHAITCFQYIEKLYDVLESRRDDPPNTQVSSEEKERIESTMMDAGDTKDKKENCELSRLQVDGKEISSNIEIHIKKMIELIEKMPMENEKQMKDKNKLCYKFGVWLANPKSKFYDPVLAYRLLSNFKKPDNTRHAVAEIKMFEEANSLCYQLLMSGDLILNEEMDEISILPVKQKSKPSTHILSLDMIKDIESESSRLLRLKVMIKHLLASNNQDKSIVGKLMADYALGQEYSMSGIVGISGNDFENQMVLIENLRMIKLKLDQQELDNKKLKSENERLKLENQNHSNRNQPLDATVGNSASQTVMPAFNALRTAHSSMVPMDDSDDLGDNVEQDSAIVLEPPRKKQRIEKCTIQ